MYKLYKFTQGIFIGCVAAASIFAISYILAIGACVHLVAGCTFN